MERGTSGSLGQSLASLQDMEDLNGTLEERSNSREKEDCVAWLVPLISVASACTWVG